MYIWEEKYSVGIQSIDIQHEKIFRLLSNLLEAMKQGQASNVTTQIILELEQYSFIHFHKEEFFFQRFNYSGFAEHISEHQFFIQKVAELKAELNSGAIALSFELLSFLKAWIEHHILVVDKQYSECFLQNGLK
jgi:hemerythrin-like metal-binding protein